MEDGTAAETVEPTTDATAETAAPAETTEGAAPAGKTYTDAEVQGIVSKRVNELNKRWERFGKPEDLDQRLTRAQQIEQWAEQMRAGFTDKRDLPGRTSAAPLTEEDKKVQQYMERLYPGITKYQERLQAFEGQTQQLNDFRWQQIADRNRQSLSELATKAGYKPEQILATDPAAQCIEKYVADSIRGNAKDYQDYLKTGSPEIVKRHFEAVHNWIGGFAPKPPAATPPNVTAAKDAAKLKGLPPRMPAGGVTAPTSGKKKMSDRERIDAAHAAFSKT